MSLFVVAMIAACVSDPAPDCGSAQEAYRALQQEAARLVPGMTFDQVRAAVGDPWVAEEFWGEPPREDLNWFLVGRHLNRAVGQTFLCDFDEHDALLGCEPWGEAFPRQIVSFRDWTEVRRGWGLRRVTDWLCPPSETVAVDPRTATLIYSVTMPPGNRHGSCEGRVKIRRNRVSEKKLICL